MIFGGGVCSESISSKIIHTRWHRRPKRITLVVQTSLYQAQTCVHMHTHRHVHTKRLPPQTPTDTQPHPSISMRMAGREPRVGGDARGLTGTQPHAMKHSLPPPPNTQEHMEPTNTCTQCHCTHENAPCPCTKHRNRSEHTHAIIAYSWKHGHISLNPVFPE